MHPINVMIKPASASCNLRCKYCFYADEAAIRQVPNYGKMSREPWKRWCGCLCKTSW